MRFEFRIRLEAELIRRSAEFEYENEFLKKIVKIRDGKIEGEKLPK